MLSLAACSGGDGGDGGDVNINVGGSGGGGGTTETREIECEEPASLSVSGVYGALLNLVVEIDSDGSSITICPKEQLAEVQMYVLMKLQQDADDPTRIEKAELRVCDLVMPEVTGKVGICAEADTNLIKTNLTVPEALRNHLRNLPPEPVGARLSNLEPGATLTMDRFNFFAGTSANTLPAWNSAKTGCGALDTGVGRGRICSEACVEGCNELTDDDQDGFPGVTLSICGLSPVNISEGVQCNAEEPAFSGATLDGKAWVALNIDPQLEGTVKSSCQFSGKVASSVVYTLVGGDVFLSTAPLAVAAAIDNLPSFIVKSDQSPFSAVRVDGEYAAPNLEVSWDDADGSCATFLGKRNELFD